MNKTADYDYNLPQELIATHPVTPADSAKLLVYDKSSKKVTHAIFSEILDFLPKNLSIFLNDTKVIKARVYGTKQSGGKVELLLNKPMTDNSYLVYIRGRVRVGTILEFDHNLKAEVLELLDDGSRVVKFYQNNNLVDFSNLITILNQIGHIPLPPYIDREDSSSDEKDYQTLFAKNYGAVAAPTASLHFTPELLNKIASTYQVEYLTLHVGAGTFKSVEAKEILNHDIHSEYFEIPKQSCKLIDNSKNILAVGTTVTRTIEYYDRTKESFGECDLFLNPYNKPQKVNHLLTNFHLPKSTLIMLVASFIGLEETMRVYQEAIDNNYRFYSYGDAMIII
jgi:S-adenosylmethionine:tRNA ribosyltransferase-isomerase